MTAFTFFPSSVSSAIFSAFLPQRGSLSGRVGDVIAGMRAGRSKRLWLVYILTTFFVN
jgi:hypothetical protein